MDNEMMEYSLRTNRLIFIFTSKGTIVRPRGPTNFGMDIFFQWLILVGLVTDLYPLSTGWDPIFEHGGKTYAEMAKEEKVQSFLCVDPHFYCC